MASQADVHRKSFIASNNILWQSAQYSDMTVRCGAQEFKLHRAIVCLRSKFFSKACDGQFQEAQTGVIVLKEDDPPTICRMFNYLYILDYDDEGDSASIEPYMIDSNNMNVTVPYEPLVEAEANLFKRLLNNITVYAAAEKYDIAELKVLAQEKVQGLICQHSLTSDISTIIDAVFLTTPSTDNGLRKIAINFCKKNASAIVRDDRLNRMLRDHGDLGLGMVLGMLCDHADEIRSAELRGQALTRRLAKVKSILHGMDASSTVSSLNSTNSVNGVGLNNMRLSVANLQERIIKAKEVVKND